MNNLTYYWESCSCGYGVILHEGEIHKKYSISEIDAAIANVEKNKDWYVTSKAYHLHLDKYREGRAMLISQSKMVYFNPKS